MQFNVGDVVVHPAHGVGRIVKLEEKRLFGAEARLYYELSTAKSTVWVPVEGNLTAALRPVTSKNALAHYRNLLKSRSAALDKDHRQRNFELNARLKDGSFQAVCGVIRDLTSPWPLCYKREAFRIFSAKRAHTGVVLNVLGHHALGPCRLGCINRDADRDSPSGPPGRLGAV